MPAFWFACLAYFAVALPGSTLGVLWPATSKSFAVPPSSLGALLVFGTLASLLSSTLAGRILARTRAGPVVAASAFLLAAALALESVAPALWVFALGMAVFGLGFGALDSGVNIHAASHFGPRQANWMHAAYGLGAALAPAAVSAALGQGLGWRATYAVFAVLLAAVTLVLAFGRRAWASGSSPAPALPSVGPPRAVAKRPPRARVFASAVFSASETGVESGAGVWGYVFLARGYGLSEINAGLVVSAYWAMMFVGRAVLGPVAGRVGTPRVLAGAVVGVAAGAALMAAPGPPGFAIAGMMALGLAAAPIFPLLAQSTPERLATEATGATFAVGLQVAASAAGSAALPAAIGVAMGTFGDRILAPSLFVLALTMVGVYWFWVRAKPRGQSAQPSRERSPAVLTQNGPNCRGRTF